MSSQVASQTAAADSCVDLKSRIVEFARRASTEISPHDEELLPVLAQKLDAGTTVYVAHTPKATLDDVVRVAVKAQSLGLRASPHIAARRLESERALRGALDELKSHGVEQILLIAGDRERPAGKFTNTLEVLDTGATLDAGIGFVGVAGHPEGHRSIGPTLLRHALERKQAYAERTGIRMHIVTQFGFNPEAVCAWARQLAANGITLPTHVGIAGPTPLPKLIKFAMHCGIGASLGTLVRNMSPMGSLARMRTGPDEILSGVVRGCTTTPTVGIVSPHFYSFGGIIATASWMRAVMNGSFELRADSDKFALHG